MTASTKVRYLIVAGCQINYEEEEPFLQLHSFSRMQEDGDAYIPAFFVNAIGKAPLPSNKAYRGL